MRSTLILVTGQHRSGTSAAAGCLKCLGVELGARLMPANEANPKGYFEDMRAVKTHDWLLHELGASWDRPWDVPDEKPGSAVEKATGHLAGIVYEFSTTSRLFAIKDPRASLFVPLWQEACDRMNTRLVLLTPQRLEEAVARSLVRREGWQMERAAAVVQGYRLALEGIDPGILRESINFPDGLWQASEWERVARGLDVPLDVRGGIRKLHGFLDYGLVHHG